MNKFYVTTPIYYVNSYPHLGHLYTTLIADTVARYKRQRGAEVFFLTGTDEHGINIERAAEAAGLPVKQHVDRIVDSFKTAFEPYNLTNQHWIRTTDEYHKQGVRKLWQRAAENGFIYKGKYEGWYCGNCNEFYSEDEAKVLDGNVLVCPTHDRPLDRIAEESYFFKLSAFQDKLIEHYEQNPHFIRPDTRRNEVLSFVRGGLNDLSVSRVSVKWGIPVPDDPSHTMYVWFDALSNYITAIGYGNDQFGGEEHFKKFWPADLQLVGKDILRFHTVYWPAFLMAAGVDLPRTVYSHGMWLSGGRRMSKTLGNVIDLAVLQKHFTTDAVRYFALREMVFGQDGDFTYEALLDRVNADLASGLGNLAARTLTMVRNYCDGIIPAPGAAGAELTVQANEVREAVEQAVAAFDREFDEYNFSRAIEAVSTARFRVDKFISDAKPWDLAKDPAQRGALELVLHTAAESLRFFVALLAPVLPNAAQAIWQQLGESSEVGGTLPGSLNWGEARQKQIGEITPIFPRLDKKKVMAEIKEEEAASQAARAQEVKPEAPAEAELVETAQATTPTASLPAASEPVAAPEGIAYIGIEDFLKVELRAGEIKTAERIPKADKLLRFTIDLGEAAPRQILAGIAQYYEPEQLIGRKVIVVANLAPRKLRGLESQGMILAASIGEEGRPVLAGFLEEVPNGAKLK
ncbi:MAG: methionine--tRNA ligase [Acidobacteriota bacterium]|nr:methionine--tRNA ligase [Acidobacteriota bacterium]